LELLRLRGEVGRLRRELGEQKVLAAKLAEITNGAAQTAAKIEPQIHIQARFFTGTDEALESFQDNSTGIVESKEMEKLLKRLQESENVELLTVQRVATLSGRQAQVNGFESKTNLSTGAVTESGHTLDVLPTLRGDGRSVDNR
jgi:hypothetical protein